MIDIAFEVAQKAHEGQYDKGGKPYINHPIAVSKMVHTEDEKIVALLHDSVEDSNIILADLKEYGFSDKVLNAIDCMTKRAGETYEEYIERVSQNSLAIKVKSADLTHNSDISRIKNPSKKDIERTQKYKRTLEKLKVL